MAVPDSDATVLAQRAARYAAAPIAATVDGAEVVVFTRGPGRYAIALEHLREIRALKHFCALPGASHVVPGVFHHRGEVLSAHDLASFLGADPAPAGGWVLVVEHTDRIGLLADDLLGVERVAAAGIREVPLALGSMATCFSGVLDGGALLLRIDGMFACNDFFLAN